MSNLIYFHWRRVMPHFLVRNSIFLTHSHSSSFLHYISTSMRLSAYALQFHNRNWEIGKNPPRSSITYSICIGDEFDYNFRYKCCLLSNYPNRTNNLAQTSLCLSVCVFVNVFIFWLRPIKLQQNATKSQRKYLFVAIWADCKSGIQTKIENSANQIKLIGF